MNGIDSIFNKSSDDVFYNYFKNNLELNKNVSEVYKKNEKYLDGHFLKNFRIDFLSRLFELYISDILRNCESEEFIRIKKSNESGSDFEVDYKSNKFSIQCSCPSFSPD